LPVEMAYEDRWGNQLLPVTASATATMARLVPSRKGDHSQMLLSANDMEAVLGDAVMNGIEDIESRIRKLCMDQIANGVDLLVWFRRFDVNRDGSITRAELLQGLMEMGIKLEDFLDANEELDLFMKKIDRGIFQHERDTKVDYQEFIKFIMSHGDFSAHTIDKGIHRPVELLQHQGVKLVGLLFGQHWNPTYLKVLDKISAFYNCLKSHGENRFQIVYVSMDQSQAHFTDRYRHMPWLAIPFNQKERRFFLAKKYFVTTTPRLVLTDVHGNLISYDAKNDCCDYAHKPWIAMDSWLNGKIREISHAGGSFH